MHNYMEQQLKPKCSNDCHTMHHALMRLVGVTNSAARDEYLVVLSLRLMNSVATGNDVVLLVQLLC